MLDSLLELVLLLASLLAVAAAGVHFVDSVRGYRAASLATTRSAVRLIVARMGLRATILRFLFALLLLASGVLLVRVPRGAMDYPFAVNLITAMFITAAVLIVLFCLRDLRDRARIAEMLREDSPRIRAA